MFRWGGWAILLRKGGRDWKENAQFAVESVPHL